MLEIAETDDMGEPHKRASDSAIDTSNRSVQCDREYSNHPIQISPREQLKLLYWEAFTALPPGTPQAATDDARASARSYPFWQALSELLRAATRSNNKTERQDVHPDRLG
jgi:hypothetical protein